MFQMNIYECLNPLDDPLFTSIKELKKGNFTVFGADDERIYISYNLNEMYEVQNNNLHELFTDIKECYKFVNRLGGQ